MDKQKMIYHYCSTESFSSIIASKTLRMSDILKSNDFEELLYFYPTILYEIRKQYARDPFDLKYQNIYGEDALKCLLDDFELVMQSKLMRNEFTNYVVCFCEVGDVLSQWRGYANDGKGCSIGISLNYLFEVCIKSKDVFSLVKIEYKTAEEMHELLEQYVQEILKSLNGLREWIVENMTKNDEDEDTDGLLSFNFSSFVEATLINSLRFKSKPFEEEQEWRLFFTRDINKNPDWIFGREIYLQGPSLFDETYRTLRNKMGFHIKEDDIVTFYPLKLVDDDDKSAITEVIIGPKNKTAEADMELFLTSNKLYNIEIKCSEITYR